MPNPSNLPPHIHRARWLTTLTASLSSPILWRACRDRYYLLNLHRSTLDIEIHKLSRIVSTFDIWSFPRLSSFFTSYLSMHDFVISQYAELMSSLAPPTKPWGKRRRVFRERTVKMGCVLHQYAWVLLYSFDDVFGERGKGMGWVEKCGALKTPGRLTRRWSEGDVGFQSPETLENRRRVEIVCNKFAKGLERAMLTCLLDVRGLYNEGYLFKEFWRYVRRSNDAMKREKERRGKKYKYPEEMWTLKVSEEKKWKPIDGCPSWEEDVELGKLFP